MVLVIARVMSSTSVEFVEEITLHVEVVLCG